MKKLVLTSYVAHIPEIPREAHKLTWHLPPCIATGKGFDLDPSPLLIVDKLIVDTTTYNYLLNCEQEFLLPLRDTLQVLHKEEFIELKNFAELAKKNAKHLEEATDRALEAPERWLESVRQHWKGWEKLQPKISEAMGKDYDKTVTPMDMGVFSYMHKQGKVNEEEADRLTKILFSTKKRRTSSEWIDVKEMIRPHISYVHLNFLIRAELGYPFLDWENMSELNQTAVVALFCDLQPEEVKDRQRLAVAEKLFSVALPELRPESPSQVIKLLNKRNVKRLREKIDEIIETGEELTQAWGAEARDAALQANIKVADMKVFTSWFSNALSFVPGANIAAIPIEESLNYFLSWKFQRKHKWLYSLLKAKSDH